MLGAIAYRRGSVYLIDFPPPDNSPAIRKFALCVQGSVLLHGRRERFLGALVTTKNLESKYPWDVLLSPAESHSATGARVVLSELHTIMKEWVIEHKYDLTPETMRAVDKALLVSLGLVDLKP
ncbi:MAG: type II toxin-antitoxin system PemK/MazF family toxin [Chloroflexota bacterium]|nr:type II toxin-antitoxin system PemK/MazF family toxin [Chloroflexota bacterium]